MDKQGKAEKLFAEGCNCSQAVLAAFASDFGYGEGDALRFALSFGAGMGRMQHTCGAVTGAYMVIGLVATELNPNLPLPDLKKKAYALTQEFAMRFSLIHKTAVCRELLGVDLSTHEGNEKAMKDNLFGTLCRQYVVDAVGILEDLIRESREE